MEHWGGHGSIFLLRPWSTHRSFPGTGVCLGEASRRPFAGRKAPDGQTVACLLFHWTLEAGSHFIPLAALERMSILLPRSPKHCSNSLEPPHHLPPVSWCLWDPASLSESLKCPEGWGPSSLHLPPAWQHGHPCGQALTSTSLGATGEVVAICVRLDKLVRLKRLLGNGFWSRKSSMSPELPHLPSATCKPLRSHTCCPQLHTHRLTPPAIPTHVRHHLSRPQLPTWLPRTPPSNP